MTLEFLFEQFCKERTDIKNSSPHTIASYQRSFKTYQKCLVTKPRKALVFPPSGLPRKSKTSGTDGTGEIKLD